MNPTFPTARSVLRFLGLQSGLSVLLGALIALPPAAVAQATWDPSSTWVFAVGVLKFDNPKVTPYPDEGRVDSDMIAAMKQRGVSAERIVFIKNEEATKENITRQFAPFLKRAGAGDTLIFYYTGHGSRHYNDPARTCTFLTFDTKQSWTVASIFDTVARNFSGQQVIYLADCCHAGALEAEAKRRNDRAAVLASAHLTSTSTGNWTFTRCLVDLLNGSPLTDLNGDGRITFDEASQYVGEEMAFMENQQSSHVVAGGFSNEWVLSTATGQRSGRVGERLEGESQGKWWKAKVIEEKDGKLKVTWPGWDAKYNEWLPPERTRPFVPELLPPNTSVQIKWGSKWWDGVIVRTQPNGLHLVHYTNYPEGDDEWVPMKRIRKR